MAVIFGERLRAALAPPRYLSLPLSGIDLSTSGAKAVLLEHGAHGLTLSRYAEARLPAGAFVDGEVADRAVVVEAVKAAAKAVDIRTANVALSESKAYLFSLSSEGTSKDDWRTAVEQRLEELVPLPPAETVFDVVGVGQARTGGTLIAGVGLARRIVEDLLSVCDEAGIAVQALESETFALARALLPRGDQSTALIIDVGKTTTKMAIVSAQAPRFATTIGIGGHALTLAVQKHFGVTEAEARKIKAERGIVPGPGNEDYLAAMLSTLSAIRDEVARRLEYWQEKAGEKGDHEPVSHAILAGGNASVRGLAEYLEAGLRVPVTVADVFTNFAPREAWVPELDHADSLAYATAIGLALRDRPPLYA
ncbi:MAG: pilus assembly protein PilM [bacterium]|nr:pilus assembly protein PilM [bacterium]